MICQACFVVCRGDICGRCRETVRPGPEWMLAGSARVVSALSHSGAAATMMHGLKYRGNESILRMIAPLVPDLVPPHRILVPIPRVWTRYLRYGIDPAQRLAAIVARETGGWVLDLLDRPVHNRRRAGSPNRGDPPRFRASAVRRGVSVVLVDDVVTSGATLLAAARAIHPINVEFFFTATSAKQVSSPREYLPIEKSDTAE